jgi:hypothetical protein
MALSWRPRGGGPSRSPGAVAQSKSVVRLFENGGLKMSLNAVELCVRERRKPPGIWNLVGGAAVVRGRNKGGGGRTLQQRKAGEEIVTKARCIEDGPAAMPATMCRGPFHRIFRLGGTSPPRRAQLRRCKEQDRITRFVAPKRRACGATACGGFWRVAARPARRSQAAARRQAGRCRPPLSK